MNPVVPDLYTADGTSEAATHNVWRVREDLWEYLIYTAEKLGGRHSSATKRRLSDDILQVLDRLELVEGHWATPGLSAVNELRSLIHDGDFVDLGEAIERVKVRRRRQATAAASGATGPDAGDSADNRPRFEVLLVDDCTPEDGETFVREMLRQRRPQDPFVYEINIVPSYEDAVAALLLNTDIQACIIRPGFKNRTRRPLEQDIRDFVSANGPDSADPRRPIQRILALAEKAAELRPTLDLYLVAGVSIEKLGGSLTNRFSRIFLRADSLELHLSILKGVGDRFETPFFTAIQNHSRRPGGVFHALPVSRGGSVSNSKWIKDMEEFYGLNLLLAETSATSGGLDSLLDPHGSIRDAQRLAARAFGSRQSFFVTNGTSTANKIVHQAMLAPGDVVLVDRNCHKSHHYALLLAGAKVAYLEAYSINEFSLYGGVPTSSIKKMLLNYRAAGRLGEVKMLALTNCTFDGIVYDVERVMEECLAIKPDLVFLWDEAWFAFAGFHPIYRRRTAMAASQALERRFRAPAARETYAAQAAELYDPETGEPLDDDLWLKTRLVPDPDKARIRVYATQSTHKTLTSLRQGSMIHVYDQDFAHLSEEAFREAYMTHTSTSPNYQILASLDIGRRQAELEGCELVQKQADLAASVATAIEQHPLLRRYFRILNTLDLVPAEFRETQSPMPLVDGLARMAEAWGRDEFVVDPSRLTMYIGATGVDGDTFRHHHLMDGHGIQVNKTSRNSVLIMTNIGTSRSSVAYLIEVLVKLAETFASEADSRSPRAKTAHSRMVAKLTKGAPPLPDFSSFASRFRTDDALPDANIRTAYFETYKPDACEYLTESGVRKRLTAGEEVISAAFVTPYPPGFPVLVPGQLIDANVLDFMAALDTREIHGYDKQHGYRVVKTSGDDNDSHPPLHLG
ncbi:aminotransferase class I/II-fold pyridoxal phosphate-dependent enzyme [Arthrobacter sp. HMWF013]|uniref:aminotransferase class I/II-fold pyridoxal phosphate-dependent enzyme n=1 Tax=Arthrobacter sp. HMWF013 TaxID=2056849 RepID=UPI002159FD26|nr:aminotransferase class I/II-fold pyridoxal phosphate-dependent enzyme [Arthrobacter sp. HMWF013]